MGAEMWASGSLSRKARKGGKGGAGSKVAGDPRFWVSGAVCSHISSGLPGPFRRGLPPSWRQFAAFSAPPLSTRRKSQLGSCQPNFFLYMKPSSRESDRTGRADRELRQPVPSCHLPTSHGGFFALLSLDVREREAKHQENPHPFSRARARHARHTRPCDLERHARGRGAGGRSMLAFLV